MNKNKRIILAIAFMLLFTGIVLATSTPLSASSEVIIYAFDQNPAGSDEGNEWVTFHNPSNESVNIVNWTFESTHGTTAIDWIAEGTTLYPGAYCTYTPPYGWLDNSEDAIILRNVVGEEVDRTPVVSDNENDNRYWMRNNSEEWTFGVKELEKGGLWSGYVKNVVDGDTVDVRFNIYGIRRVRLVGINTPEIGEEGYEEAKAFVNTTCLGEEVTLDVDDKKQYDPHYRILAVVYVNDTNLNEKMVREGYAEVLYIPPSEFDSCAWKEDYAPSPSTTLSLTLIPTLSPSPDYTPSPIPTPHPNISKISNEKISLFAEIVTIICGVLTVVSILGSFFYRKKEKKSKTHSSYFFYLLIGSLVFLFIGIAIIIIIDFITMVFTIISAIFTGIIAISTIIIAIIAYLYVYCPEPNVVAYLRLKPLGIYVENIGRGIALNGKIRVFHSDEAVRQFKNERKRKTNRALNSIISKISELFGFKSHGEIATYGEKKLFNEFDVLHMYQHRRYAIKDDLLESVREKEQLIFLISYEDDRGFHIDKKIFIPYNLLKKNEETYYFFTT